MKNDSLLFNLNNINSMDINDEFYLEPELNSSFSDDGDDYDLMFCNQKERFVGSLQDRVIYSPFYMDGVHLDF